MDIHEDPEITTSEKVTRFGCGALLGIFVGASFAVRHAYSSFGLLVAVFVAAVFLCGFLALKYGDAFWYSLKDCWRWWR
jgi:hypothetical protein